MPHLFHFGKFPPSVLIITEVLFVAHEDDGYIRAEMFHFWCPLFWNIFCDATTEEKC